MIFTTWQFFAILENILSVFDNEGGEKRVNFRVVGRNTIVKNGD